jgi:hypothetical protein
MSNVKKSSKTLPSKVARQKSDGAIPLGLHKQNKQTTKVDWVFW